MPEEEKTIKDFEQLTGLLKRRKSVNALLLYGQRKITHKRQYYKLHMKVL